MREGDLLQAWAEALAPYLRPLLATATSTPARYATDPPRAWPPGCTNRRQARERLRAAGATCIGRGKSSVWVLDAAAYIAATQQRKKARPVLRLVTPLDDDEQLAEAALSDAKLRPTRRGER